MSPLTPISAFRRVSSPSRPCRAKTRFIPADPYALEKSLQSKVVRLDISNKFGVLSFFAEGQGSRVTRRSHGIHDFCLKIHGIRTWMNQST